MYSFLTSRILNRQSSQWLTFFHLDERIDRRQLAPVSARADGRRAAALTPAVGVNDFERF